MQQLTSSGSNRERHFCTGARHGDWIVYACTECDYELREHWQTGVTRMVNPKQNIYHSGSYLSPAYEQLIHRLN
jgi:hypothetical protein